MVKLFKKSEHKNEYVIYNIYKSFFMATIVSVLASTLCDSLDNILAGHFLGINELAALSLVSPILLFRSAAVYLPCSGANFLCNYYTGIMKEKETNNIFTIAFVLSLILGGMFTLFFIFGAPFIVTALDAENKIISTYAIQYLHGYGIGMIPCFLYYLMISLVSSSGSNDLVVCSTIVLGVANVISYFIILSVFSLGVFGIGLSTSISYVCALAVTLLHFRRPINSFRFIKPFNVLPELMHCTKRGSLQGAKYVGFALESLCLNAIVFAFGDANALAALVALNTVHGITSNVISGSNGILSSMIGIFDAERDKRAMEQAVYSSFRIGRIISVIFTLAIFIFAPFICSICGLKSGAALHHGVLALRCYAIVIFPEALGLLIEGIQEGLNKNVLNIVIYCIRFFVLSIPLSFLFANCFSIDGVWFAYLLSILLPTVLYFLFIQLKTGNCFEKKNWILLPKNWSDRGVVLAFFMDNNKDAYFKALKSISGYCQKNGFSKTVSNSIMLISEEASSLILENSRKKNEYENIDFRLLLQKGNLYLRLRYIGRPYNPLSEEKNQDSLEMKLIEHFSKKNLYSYEMDINNLIVHVCETEE